MPDLSKQKCMMNQSLPVKWPNPAHTWDTKRKDIHVQQCIAITLPNLRNLSGTEFLGLIFLNVFMTGNAFSWDAKKGMITGKKIIIKLVISVMLSIRLMKLHAVFPHVYLHSSVLDMELCYTLRWCRFSALKLFSHKSHGQGTDLRLLHDLMKQEILWAASNSNSHPESCTFFEDLFFGVCIECGTCGCRYMWFDLSLCNHTYKHLSKNNLCNNIMFTLVPYCACK